MGQGWRRIPKRLTSSCVLPAAPDEPPALGLGELNSRHWRGLLESRASPSSRPCSLHSEATEYECHLVGSAGTHLS